MKNYYNILGIKPDSEIVEIKKAYRKLAFRFHPDKNNSLDAAKLFIEIHEAYQVLSDPLKRAKYDNLHNLIKSNREAQETEEVMIFNQESSNLGKEKAKQYSQMSYEEYRKYILKEINLHFSYTFHYLTIIIVSMAALFFLISIIGDLLKRSDFNLGYFLYSIGSIAIVRQLYKNLRDEYRIDKENLKI